MEKTKKYYICDRCKKELKVDEINHGFYNMWSYDLCNECKELFDTFKVKVNSLKNQCKELEKEYKFGDYLESKGE